MTLCQFEIENERSILPVPVGSNRTHIPTCPEQWVLKEQQHIEFNHAKSYPHGNGIRIDIQHFTWANGLSASNRVAFCGRAAANA
jgi:hypothetical protein